MNTNICSEVADFMIGQSWLKQDFNFQEHLVDIEPNEEYYHVSLRKSSESKDILNHRLLLHLKPFSSSQLSRNNFYFFRTDKIVMGGYYTQERLKKELDFEQLDLFIKTDYFKVIRSLLDIPITYFGLDVNTLKLIICKSEDLLKHVNPDLLPFYVEDYPKYLVAATDVCVRDVVSEKFQLDLYHCLFEPYTLKNFLVAHNLDEIIKEYMNRDLLDFLSQ